MLSTDQTHGAPYRAGADGAAAEIDGATFRRVMGSWLSGVSVISSMSGDHPLGMTCSAVCSVSASPPMLLACLNSSSATLTAITDARAFTVCVLDTDSRAISELFAAPGHEQYAMVDWQRAGHTQMPILKAALAYAECTVHGISEAGDHTVVFGTVVGGSADHTRDPLGYWRTNYLRLPNAIEIYGKADAVWIGEL